MRSTPASALASLAFVAALFGASREAAADPIGKESTVKADRQGSVSGASGDPGQVGGATAATEGPGRIDPDRPLGAPEKEKAWEVQAGWEGHGLVRQNDLEGAAADKYFNYFFASFDYDFTKYDRVSVTAGVYQRFLSDPQETGARLDDIVAQYRRYIPLPKKVNLYVSGSLLAPTSFISYREGLITAPRVGVRVQRTFADYVDVSARVSGAYFVQSHNTMRDGTSPNPAARLSAGVDADVTMPFHKPLSAGVALYTSYGWYHAATSTLPSEPGAGEAGSIPDGQFPTQPITQTYGGEIHVRYVIPDFIKDVHFDASVAFAEGDPSLGYNSVLHDGLSHFYLFYRLDSEVYGTLTARY